MTGPSRALSLKENNMYDIIIVGGGPAGLCAAVYARRANKSVLILEKNAFGGQIVFSPKVENYPGFETISGGELADKLVSQVLAQGADVEIETVTAIRCEGETRIVETEDGNCYEGHAVILANGAQHRHHGGVVHEGRESSRPLPLGLDGDNAANVAFVDQRITHVIHERKQSQSLVGVHHMRYPLSCK